MPTQGDNYSEAFQHIKAPQESPQQPFQGSPLRKEAPITQKPAPVFHAQPIASTFQGNLFFIRS